MESAFNGDASASARTVGVTLDSPLFAQAEMPPSRLTASRTLSVEELGDPAERHRLRKPDDPIVHLTQALHQLVHRNVYRSPR